MSSVSVQSQTSEISQWRRNVETAVTNSKISSWFHNYINTTVLKLTLKGALIGFLCGFAFIASTKLFVALVIPFAKKHDWAVQSKMDSYRMSPPGTFGWLLISIGSSMTGVYRITQYLRAENGMLQVENQPPRQHIMPEEQAPLMENEYVAVDDHSQAQATLMIRDAPGADHVINVDAGSSDEGSVHSSLLDL